MHVRARPLVHVCVRTHVRVHLTVRACVCALQCAPRRLPVDDVAPLPVVADADPRLPVGQDQSEPIMREHKTTAANATPAGWGVGG